MPSRFYFVPLPGICLRTPAGTERTTINSKKAQPLALGFWAVTGTARLYSSSSPLQPPKAPPVERPTPSHHAPGRARSRWRAISQSLPPSRTHQRSSWGDQGQPPSQPPTKPPRPAEIHGTIPSRDVPTPNRAPPTTTLDAAETVARITPLPLRSPHNRQDKKGYTTLPGIDQTPKDISGAPSPPSIPRGAPPVDVAYDA